MNNITTEEIYLTRFNSVSRITDEAIIQRRLYGLYFFYDDKTQKAQNKNSNGY